MILFGYKTRPKVIGGANTTCKNCKRRTAHGLVKLTEWFTLYFIPIIPLANDLLYVCGRCGYRIKVEGEEKRAVLMRLKQLPAEASG